MRKVLAIVFVLALGPFDLGCIVPMYSSSPERRVQQLIYVSEGLRHIPDIWERVWALEMPDVATPYRTHGGVI